MSGTWYNKQINTIVGWCPPILKYAPDSSITKPSTITKLTTAAASSTTVQRSSLVTHTLGMEKQYFSQEIDKHIYMDDNKYKKSVYN